MSALSVYNKLYGTIYIAFSGGVDSIASALYFKNRKLDVQLLHFNHGCEFSDQIEHECRAIADKLNLPIIVGHNKFERKQKQSLEDFWRRARYNFLYEHTPEGEHLVTGHHLDDAIETWVWSSLHGEGKIILPKQVVQYCDKTITLVRPFIMNNKQSMVDYVTKYDMIDLVVEDKYNVDMSLIRNHIRHKMMPDILKVNKGIEKVIKKKYLNLRNTEK